MSRMKTIFALAFFIAVATATANAEGYPAGAKLFGYQVVPPGIGFSVENFTCGEKTAYAIVSYDEPAAFFTLNKSQGEIFPGIRPITDITAIADGLNCYYIENGHNPNITGYFSKIHSEIAVLEDDDDRGETGCRILLGTDMRKCVSFETCQEACYGVTSFCQPVALGAGRKFIEEIWAFENSSRALNAAYSAEKEAYSAFAKNTSKEMALAYIDAINETLAIAERAAGSPLFYDYSFCFSPDYPFYSLYLLKTRAERQYQDSSVFYNIPNRSQEIANQTKVAIEKKTKYRLPEVGVPKAACTAGVDCESRTLEYDEAGEQAETQSFITNFLNGIVSFFQDLVRWK